MFVDLQVLEASWKTDNGFEVVTHTRKWETCNWVSLINRAIDFFEEMSGDKFTRKT